MLILFRRSKSGWASVAYASFCGADADGGIAISPSAEITRAEHGNNGLGLFGRAKKTARRSVGEVGDSPRAR